MPVNINIILGFFLGIQSKSKLCKIYRNLFVPTAVLAAEWREPNILTFNVITVGQFTAASRPAADCCGAHLLQAQAVTKGKCKKTNKSRD